MVKRLLRKSFIKNSTKKLHHLEKSLGRCQWDFFCLVKGIIVGAKFILKPLNCSKEIL
jgi:hypothetical protein